MKKEAWMFLFFGIFLFILFLNFTDAVTRTCYSCENCTAEIGNSSSGDVIQLNSSITTLSDCISFNGKDNVTFTCENYSKFIQGSIGSGVGISVSSLGVETSENIEISNCNLTGFQYGIYLNLMNNSKLTNITLLSNASSGTLYGVYMQSNFGINITNLTIFGNQTDTGSSTFYLSQFNKIWEEKYKHHFSVDYETKDFLFNPVDNSVKIKITQKGSEFAGIDQLSLEACGKKVRANYIKDLTNNENVLSDLNSLDNNIVTMEKGKTIEALWKISYFCKEPVSIFLNANEYPSSNNFFRSPAGDDYLNYTFQNRNKFMWIDGKISEVDRVLKPLYEFFWIPGTGHPEGNTYVYITEDKKNVYFSLDITPDNTDDYGKDWAKILIKSGNVEKEFKIDDYHNEWGKCDFGLTSKVKYKHQTCEFKIPKKEFDDTKEIYFALEYYGTASPTAMGIYISNSNQIRIINSTIKHFHSSSSYGIYVISSNLLFFSGITSFFNPTHGIDLHKVNDSVLTNINSSNSNMGIYVDSSSNNTFNEIDVAYDDYGMVFYSGSDNNFLTNIRANNNPSMGIELNSRGTGLFPESNSDNNSFIDITTNYNGYGVHLVGGLNNSFNNLISHNNILEGIYIYTGNNSLFTNISVKNNSYTGIKIINANNNTFIDSNILENTIGISFEGYSQNNTIKDSFIQLSNNSALRLNNTFGGYNPKYNLIYNNYFNNSVAFSNISTSALNYFNITKTAGTNIIGGNYLAGNYWASPFGDGFSQTCTSVDGICTTAYNFDGINYDYLPLGGCQEVWTCEWSECIDRLETYNCVDANICQTYLLRPSTSGSKRDCGGSGSPLPTISETSTGGGASVSVPITSASSDKPVEIFIDNSEMDLYSIFLNLKKEISNASVVITKLNETLEGGLPVGRLYQSFEIDLYEIEKTDVLNATFNFRINKTWLAQNNISIDFHSDKYWVVENNIIGDIELYRNPNGENNWRPLITNFFREDENYFYLTANSSGFSKFAIFFNKYDCVPNSARCSGDEVQLCLGDSTWLVTQVCADSCVDGKCQNLFFRSNEFYILLVSLFLGLIAIVVVVLFNVFKKRYNK